MTLPDLKHADAQEKQRLAALDSYRILDTAPESAFDDIVGIAAPLAVAFETLRESFDVA